jgi:hypothetical protein
MRKSNDLRYTTTKTVGKEDITVKIRLNDECKNGHQDFAITGDIYEAGKPRKDRYHISGGCIHDAILKHFPEFKIFVDLHLCDFNGIPMHPTANGYYHLRTGFSKVKPSDNVFKAEYCEYYRITEKQFDALKTSRSEIEFALLLKELGILAQWKLEAQKAINKLEFLTGQEFINDSKRSNLMFPTDEAIADYRQKLESGYYTDEAIAGRKNEAIEKKILEMEAEAEKKISEIRSDLNLKLQLYRMGGDRFRFNTIYYNHNNTIAFNWSNSNDILTNSEIEYIKANLKGFDNVTFK